MKTDERIDALVSDELAKGTGRAKLSAELLMAAALVYDIENMVAGNAGRSLAFAQLAASAYSTAYAAVAK